LLDKPDMESQYGADGAGLNATLILFVFTLHYIDACLIHVERAMALPLSLTSRRRAGRRLDMSSAVLATEAK